MRRGEEHRKSIAAPSMGVKSAKMTMNVGDSPLILPPGAAPDVPLQRKIAV
jgi:hypothetical protein